MLDNFVRVISYKSIPYAWKGSNAFIMYVPYNTPIQNKDGDMDSIGQAWCTDNLQRAMTTKSSPYVMLLALVWQDSPCEPDTGTNLQAPKGYNVHYEVIPWKRSEHRLLRMALSLDR